MKRILSLFIIACLCGSLLVGCGQAEEPVMTVPLIEQELLAPSEFEAEEDIAAPVEPALVVKKPTKGYVSPEERPSPELQEMTKEIIAKAWQAVRQEEWIVETYFSEDLVLAGENAGTYYHSGRVFNTVTGEYQYWSTGLMDDPIFDERDIEKETYIVLEDRGYITYHRTFLEPDEHLVGYDYAQECEGGKWVYTNHTGYGPRTYSPVDDMSDWQLSLVYTGDIQEVNGYSCYVLSAVVNTRGEMGYVYIDTETFLVRLIKEVLTKEAGENETSCSTTTYEYENPNHELPSWTKDAILDEEPHDGTFGGFFPVDEDNDADLWWFDDELNSLRVVLGRTAVGQPGKPASVIFEDEDDYVEQELLADIYIINSENLKFEKKGVDKEFLLAPNQFAVCTIRSNFYTYDLFLHNPSSEPIAIKDCIIFAAAWSGGYVSSVPDEYLPYLSFDLMFGVAEHQTISDGVFTSRWESDAYIAWTVSEYPNILVLQDKHGPDLLKIIHECGI